uniref:hypothetical protein n=1 Tax=Alkalibaculum bacchi TaxID=645887 RepID=UPI001652786D
VNSIIYVVAIVSATFVLIKGSNTIMRYFGVDVGLKEGFGQMAAAFALGRGASNMARGLKNLGGKSTSENNMENLPGQESNTLNNLNSDSGLKKSVNSAGKSFGYARNRGFSGMAEDAVKGTGEKITGGIKNSVNSMKDQWSDGIEQGEAKGQANQEKWDNRKSKNQSINDSNSKNASDNIAEMKAFDSGIVSPASYKENPSLENKTSINSQKSPQRARMGQISQENDSQGQTDTNLNKNGNSLQNQSNEDVLRKMRFEDAIKPGSMDTTGNIKMKPDIVSSGELGKPASASISEGKGINDVTTKQIDILANTKTNSPIGSTNQRVNQVVDNKSNIPNPVEQKINTLHNPGQAKQSIIQEVQKDSFNSNDIKQRVLQDAQSSNVATPQQLKQNVEQIFSKSSIPSEVQSSVQKIIQEVESNGSYHPEEVRSKVVQEIERASIDSPSLKQNVIQDIEKAFKATPEQEKQNIKQSIEQVIETKERQNVTSTTQQEVKQKSSGYFGALLPDDLKIEQVARKGNRFKKLIKS